MCPPEPTPCDPKFKPPGFDLAASTSSLTFLAGEVDGTTSTLGNANSGVIGWKSLFGSKRMSGVSAGRIANRPLLARNKV
jgi:hypothetical protein